MAAWRPNLPPLLDHALLAMSLEVLSTRSIFFFFKAEEGIRDIGVTGVQTCALPISAARRRNPRVGSALRGLPGRRRKPVAGASGPVRGLRRLAAATPVGRAPGVRALLVARSEIGRASCRERVQLPGSAGHATDSRTS